MVWFLLAEVRVKWWFVNSGKFLGSIKDRISSVSEQSFVEEGFFSLLWH